MYRSPIASTAASRGVLYLKTKCVKHAVEPGYWRVHNKHYLPTMQALESALAHGLLHQRTCPHPRWTGWRLEKGRSSIKTKFSTTNFCKICFYVNGVNHSSTQAQQAGIWSQDLPESSRERLSTAELENQFNMPSGHQNLSAQSSHMTKDNAERVWGENGHERLHKTPKTLGGDLLICVVTQESWR